MIDIILISENTELITNTANATLVEVEIDRLLEVDI